jgi:adenylate cyclase, class 2
MSGVEEEVKIRVPSLEGLMEGLKAIGALSIRGREFEDNLLLDFMDKRLKQEGKLIRLRRFGEQQLLTFKGPASHLGNIKSRAEIELEVGSFETMQLVLAELGLRPAFRYQKYRTIYAYRDPSSGGNIDQTAESEQQSLHIMVDETPVGIFVELEGSVTLIRKAAERLGFCQEDFMTSTYYELQEDYCRHCGRPFGDMVF